MTLSIPPEHKQLFADWVNLPESEAEHFVNAIEAQGPALTIDDLVPLVQATAGLSPDRVKNLLIMFASMMRSARELDGEELEAYPLVVHRAAIGKEPGADWPAVNARTLRLMRADSLRVAAKALHIVYDAERTFCSCRTLSDLRPIFSEDGSQAKALTTAHQLKLVYHDGPEGTLRQLFLTMRRQDLLVLRDCIQRAITKDEALAAMADKLSLPLLVSDVPH